VIQVQWVRIRTSIKKTKEKRKRIKEKGTRTKGTRTKGTRTKGTRTKGTRTKEKRKKDKGKDKKDKGKKEKKIKTKEEKNQKNEQFNKMSKEEKKAFKKGKLQKKIEKKVEVLSTDIYEPKIFSEYVEKVNNAKQEKSTGDKAHIREQALKELETAGSTMGLKIWRIEQFHIVPVLPESYGSFYSGDSYVVLNSYKVENQINYDLYFWIGESSSQDEYASAAVWTVQIDDKLGGKAVQHREVQDFESEKFLSLFHPGIRILQGGLDSAFNKVDRDAHRVRLLKIKGKKNVRITEVSALTSNLNSGDVFVLDTKDEVYQWIGKDSSVFERSKGGELCTAIRNERGAKPNIVVLEESRGDDNAKFWEHLGGKGPIPTAEEGGDDILGEMETKNVEKKLFKISDSKGSLDFTPVASGKIYKKMLDTNDVFLFDTGFEIFLWIGQGASAQERQGGLGQAQNYLKTTGRPVYLPISKIQEKSQIATFESQFD